MLLILTNDLNFDVEMVRSGDEFHIPAIVLKLLFTLKQAKSWSVDVEAVNEAKMRLFQFLVQSLKYR